MTWENIRWMGAAFTLIMALALICAWLVSIMFADFSLHEFMRELGSLARSFEEGMDP